MIYDIDPLANIVPLANEKEQLALMEDIKKNGQREPAVLWRGKLVDGRCRQLACIALNIELLVRTLDDELSREEVALIVKSLNTRRNLTITQKCVSAYIAQEVNGMSNEEVARQWAIPLGTYKNVRYVCGKRPEYVQPLFNGLSVKIVDVSKGCAVTTNKINSLARLIKQNEEASALVIDTSEELTFAADGLIKTEAGKHWYYDTVKRLDVSNVELRMIMVEYANLKFKIKD